ncbi:hypothetical protein T4B_6204 [Trichinella pseudospiralis]|uniref:Uncharacterized protein n=1 Tax=Trichinella pseudospiralis TaxID=6337 RepID=A0A0V1IZ45_TRIPS|nr:hypothetical protein T4B_6204 [Trichinella pseudospiralis]
MEAKTMPFFAFGSTQQYIRALKMAAILQHNFTFLPSQQANDEENNQSGRSTTGVCPFLKINNNNSMRKENFLNIPAKFSISVLRLRKDQQATATTIK